MAVLRKVPMMEFSIAKDMAMIISSTCPLYVLPLMEILHGDKLVPDSVRPDGEFCLVEPDDYDGEDVGTNPSISDEWERCASAFGKDQDKNFLYRDLAYQNFGAFESAIKNANEASVPATPKTRKAK